MIARNPKSKKGNRKNYLKIAKSNFKWKCMICGKEKTNDNFDLIVHHIDKNPFNNKIENLMVLCQSCHIKQHKRDMQNRTNQSKMMKEKWKKYRESKKKICPVCHKEFYAIKGKKIYCSQKCHLKNLNNLQGKEHWNKERKPWNKGLKLKK